MWMLGAGDAVGECLCGCWGLGTLWVSLCGCCGPVGGGSQVIPDPCSFWPSRTTGTAVHPPQTRPDPSRQLLTDPGGLGYHHTDRQQGHITGLLFILLVGIKLLWGELEGQKCSTEYDEYTDIWFI